MITNSITNFKKVNLYEIQIFNNYCCFVGGG